MATAKDGTLTLGAATPPQYVTRPVPGSYYPCMDGFYYLEAGNVPSWGTISAELAAETIVHEVRSLYM